jgi:hypothetical protein
VPAETEDGGRRDQYLINAADRFLDYPTPVAHRISRMSRAKQA